MSLRVSVYRSACTDSSKELKPRVRNFNYQKEHLVNLCYQSRMIGFILFSVGNKRTVCDDMTEAPDMLKLIGLKGY